MVFPAGCGEFADPDVIYALPYFSCPNSIRDDPYEFASL